MTTGTGGKPPSGSSPGRPVADTPNRLVVRSDSGNGAGDSMLGATDTAMAMENTAAARNFAPTAAGPTPFAGMPAITAELVGSTLSGKFLINKKVGQGGMGAVYEATHTQLGRRFAVKVLLEKYAQREAIVKRLKQEAQLASSIGHEHIIDITDIGTTEDGRTYVVMEYLEGESLAECLARETKLPEQRILRVISQAASALHAAHAKGIVHRDIKPENLFLLKRKDQDFVKVVDFGISKSMRASGEEEAQRLTQTGMVLGTPLYMSPEQARGDDELDARVDIYALGVIMYESATGRVPFIGNNYLSVISQVLNETPKSLRELRPDFSEEFEAIVLRAMAKKKEDRYSSANEMLADLNALLEDPTHSTERAKITGPRRKLPPKTSSARYVVWVGGVAVIVAAVAFTVKMMMSDSKPAVGPVDAAKEVKVVDAAAVPPPVIDAPEAPKEDTVVMTINTDPEGATILQDGVPAEGIDGKKVTPIQIKVLKNAEKIEFIAQLAGYDEHKFKKSPKEYEKTGMPTIKLTKAKAGQQIKYTPPRQGSGTGSNTGGGTAPPPDGLSGSPYGPQGSGTVAPKK